MTELHVSFVGSAGRVSADPARVIPAPATVDPYGAALLLAPPALTGEFLPASLWEGVTLHRPIPAPPQRRDNDPAGSTSALTAAYTHAVAAVCGDADHIGVLLSGGLDSLAVLVHVSRLARQQGRTVTAFTLDLHDDQGRSAAEVGRRLLDTLGLDCAHVIVGPAERVQPHWSAVGPRLEALPGAHAAMAAHAAARGVQVLLSGDGADEVLGAPRFVTVEVAREHGLRAATRYLRDVSASEPGWLGEALAGAGRVLPDSAAAQLYWATNWPDWCTFAPPRLVGTGFRDQVARWSRDWVTAQIRGHLAGIGRGWAQADAYDAVWPHDLIPAAGDVVEASPFLHPAVMGWAARAPLARRYDPAAASAYHRCKAAVVGLFPAPMRAALPMGKQYFCTALSRAAVRPRADRAIAAGILDGDALAGETDTAAVLTVMALEEWLAGAQERGAAIPGVCTASPRPTLAGPVPAATTGPGAGAATTTNPRGGAP